MILSRSVSLAIIIGLILAVCAVGGMLYAAGSNNAGARTAEAQAAVEAERIAMQATIEAEREKTEQIRAEADAYGDKMSANLLAYVVTKSEQRQDEMLYFIMHGETTVDRDARIMRNLALCIVAFLAFAVIGSAVFSTLDNPRTLNQLADWLAALFVPSRPQQQEGCEFQTTCQTDEVVDIE